MFGHPVAAVAEGPARELRLPLLAPGELAALESQNRQDPLLPVRPPAPSVPTSRAGAVPITVASHLAPLGVP